MVLAVVMVLALAPVGFAADTVLIYVDAVNGDDANSGGLGAPVKSLTRAFALITSNDADYEIQIAEGDYAGWGLTALPSGVNVEIYGSTSGTTTIYKRFDSELLFGIELSNFKSLEFYNINFIANDSTTPGVERNGSCIVVNTNKNLAPKVVLDNCVCDGFLNGVIATANDFLNLTVNQTKINAMYPVYMQFGNQLQITGSELIQFSGGSNDNCINYFGIESAQIIQNTIKGNQGLTKGITGYSRYAEIRDNTITNVSLGGYLRDLAKLTLNANTVYTTKSGFKVEQYHTGDGLAINGNKLVQTGICAAEQVGIDVDAYSDLLMMTLNMTGNTLANFNLAFDFNTGFETTVNMTFVGNVFRNNLHNLYVSSYMPAPFNFGVNDWGTQDLEVINYKATSAHHPAGGAFFFEPTLSPQGHTLLYVDDDFTESTPGYGLTHFSSIHDASIWIMDGGTIQVEDGFYGGRLFIHRPMKIMGVDQYALVAGPGNLGGGTPSIDSAADGLVLENLYFHGSDIAVYARSVFSIGKHFKPGDLVIKDCVFELQFSESIIYDLVSATDSSEIEISGNTFKDCTGISGVIKIYNTMADVLIENNDASVGISTFASTMTRDLIMRNNNVHIPRINSTQAVYASSYGEAEFYGNTFTLGNSVDIPADTVGINYVFAPNPVDVSGDGINYLFYNNTVSGFGKGLILSGGEPSEQYDVLISGSEDKSNNFSGNLIGLMSNFWPFGNATGETLNATYNIWGVEGAELDAYILCKANDAGYGPVTYLPAVQSTPAVLTQLSIARTSGQVLTYSPAFDASVHAYSLSVPYGVNEVVFDAVATKGILTFDDGVNSGLSLPNSVDLMVGANAFVVTLTDGANVIDYTVTVTRAGAPAPNPDPDDDVVIVDEATPLAGALVDVTLAMVEAETSAVYTHVEVAEDLTDSAEGLADAVSDVLIEGAALVELAGRDEAELVIETPFATMTFSEAALKDMAAEFADAEVFSLYAEVLAPVDGRPAYAFELFADELPVTLFGGGTFTVKVPYSLGDDEVAEAIVVYLLSEDGVSMAHAVPGSYDDGFVTMVLRHLSSYVIGYHPVAFKDVPAGAGYRTALMHMSARGYVNGYPGGAFGPDLPVTRAQFLMMLMKVLGLDWTADTAESAGLRGAVGYGMDGKRVSNFADAGNAYYSPALWMGKALGLVNGRGGNRFDPNASVTEQEAIWMMKNAVKVMDREMSRGVKLIDSSERTPMTRAEAILLLWKMVE